MMNRIFPAFALCLFACCLIHAEAQTLYYDTDPGTAAIDGGSGNWGDLNWKTTSGGTAATNWTDGANAYFWSATPLTVDLQGNTYTVGEVRNDQSNNSRYVTPTNGTLAVNSIFNRAPNMDLSGLDRLDLGSGGISYVGQNFTSLYPPVFLTADQTWNAVNVTVTLSGPSLNLQGHTLTVNNSIGANYGQSTFINMPVSNGTLRLTGAVDSAAYTVFANLLDLDTDVVVESGAIGTRSAVSGSPFGRGTLDLGTNANAAFAPTGTGSAVVYTVNTNAGSTFPIRGFNRILVDRLGQTSVDVVYGNAGDAGPIFQREGRGVIGFSKTTATTPNLGTLDLVHIAGGSNRAAIAHGIAHPYIFAYRGGGSWDPSFLHYEDAAGFTFPTFTVTTPAGLATSTLSDIVRLNNVTTPFTVTNSAAMHALELSLTTRMALGDNVTLTLGDPSVGYSGLNLFNNSITQAVGTAGGKIAFGTNELVVLVGNIGGSLLKLEGSGGLTVAGAIANGSVTLLDDNTLSGRITANKAAVYAGNGGTTGDLGTSDKIEVNSGGRVVFNRSDDVTWTGTANGDGGVVNAGSGTLDLTLTGANALGSVENADAGALNLTLSGANIFGSVLNTGSGTLTLIGAAGVTNEVTGLVPLRSLTGGTLNILGGIWRTPTLGSNGSDLQWRGTALISNAAVMVWSNGRYMHGQTVIENGGSLIANERISLGEAGNTADNPTITVNDGGYLAIVSNLYGLVIGANNASHAGSDVGIFQEGGLVDLSADSNTDLTLGQNLGSRAFYQLSGGILKVARNIQGNATAAATNHFDFTGGSLFFGTFNASSISKTGGDKGTFVNSGGRLTPGDTNSAGRMIINGHYEVDASAAALDIEIGGTLQANAVQPGTNYYDFVSVSQTATLNGIISASLIDGFVPASGAVFTVLSAGTINGAFVNAASSGSAIPALEGAGTNGSFTVEYTNDLVRLTYEPSAGGPSLTPFEEWQLLYFGGTNEVDGGANDDFDGDGLSNGDEFRAGTVPTNGASVIAVSLVTISGGDVAITWTTSGGDPSGSFGSGKTNILEAATGYDGQFTNVILTNVITTLGDQITNAVHIGGGAAEGQYYRLRIP